MDRADRLAGCLVGGAIGDALGLPLEGIRRERARRMFRGDLRYRFLLGRGMVSDDTEHACIAALALARARNDDERFARYIASGLRAWLCTIPAGAGLATLKATLRLCVGVPPSRSGVRSAGNGPAMRAAIIGAAEDDPVRMRRLCDISSRITHTDPRALDGAYLVALAASAKPASPELATDCWHLGEIEAALASGKTPAEFADDLGLDKGVTGFVAHTVPMALYCAEWARGDFEKAIRAAAALGGDTDTLCAIVGGIVGARVGYSGLPDRWVRGLWEWPRSVSWMLRLVAALANEKPPPRTFWPAYLARSPLFIGGVLAHGLRRLLPPH
ncbi:MAG TPA: ADP-ribosylglycohydrolase family protein [Fimbriimonadaceae bacterium]|nr:ADP-ribosylglycohydrolase family protein [Fimbriimonadaceae bacterium]